MKTLVFFLEEESTKAMLKSLLPRISPPNIFFEYIVFEGKQDLENRLQAKLKQWKKPDCVFAVVTDQDNFKGIKSLFPPQG